MRKLFLWLLLLSVFIMLSACAEAPEPNEAIEVATADALEACYAGEAAANEAEIAKLQTPEQVLLHRSIAELGKAANKGYDRCAGIVTNNTLQKVAMEENTKQIQVAGDVGKSAASTIVTGVLGWKAIDALPEILGAAGSDYALSSSGDMTLTDSMKTATFGDIAGENTFGGLFNPSTAEPFVLEVPIE